MNDGTRIDEGLSAAPVFETDGLVTRLLGSLCPLCGAVAFPRRVVCLECGGSPEPATLTGSGKVHSWTRLANPPFGFDEPIWYACVDLDEGPRVLAAMTRGPVAIGASVQAVPSALRRAAFGFRFEGA